MLFLQLVWAVVHTLASKDGPYLLALACPRPWSDGTDRASNTTGPGKADTKVVDQRLTRRSAI